MRFLPVALIEALHAQMIENYGGTFGLRDRGLLESSVARAENKAYYEPDASVAVVAASIAWGLIKNHAFIDGNKRVGYAALVAFVELNGHRLTCSESEETEMVLKAAAGDLDETGWTAWVESVISPQVFP